MAAHPVMEPWIWEFSTLDGATVYESTPYWSLEAVKNAIDASFADYTWEEVERRDIRGTSVLVNQYGRYVDTGHWVYRKPAPPTAPVFPGVPGSRWRDEDGDMWILGDDGIMRMTRRPTAPDVVAKVYGPMTPVGGES